MRRLVPVFVALFIIFPVLSAGAQSIPLPGNKQAVINYNADAIKQHKERQAKLKENLETVDDEIASLRASMVKVARDVRSQERDMNALEDKIDALQTRRTDLQKKLRADHAQMAGLASALIRLREIPPEALIARPGAPIETAQIALILRDALEPLKHHAQQVQIDLGELVALETDLHDRQADLKKASEKILADQTKLNDLIRRREAAYQSLQTDIKDQENDIARLAREASSFHDLLSKLEQRNRDIAKTEKEKRTAKPKSFLQANLPPPKLDSKALRSLGSVQMPVSGIIRTGYGSTDEIGSQSEGLKIEARTGALVVAPMNGIIRYKGYFKNYGNMIIIEHAKNYHSLVAGLAKIDTVVGQSVDAGEPVGTLGAVHDTRPTLYYELRQNGKPVNPARLFADLG